MYILVDDENRENEGDLVVPASNITAKKLILWLNMAGVNMFISNRQTSKKTQPIIDVTSK